MTDTKNLNKNLRPLTLKKMIKQLSFQSDSLKGILSVKVYFPVQKSMSQMDVKHWSLVFLAQYL